MSLPAAELVTREVGREAVLLPGDDGYDGYCRDESGLRGEPDAAVLPSSVEQVQALLRLAAAESLVVVPRGAGSGKAGGCVATRGGVVLSVEKLVGITELDTGDLRAMAAAGTITESIDVAAREHNLFYPPDPASLGYSSIGGNVATNAGGPSAFKYGVTRDYVLSVDVVLMGGERVRFGRDTAKGVSGLDLAALFVGSEGTLGVVVGAGLRLIPRPTSRSTLLATFPDRATAGAAVTAICTAGLWPRTLELIDGKTLAIVRDHAGEAAGRALPSSTGAGGGALLIELDGEPDGVMAEAERCGEVLAAAGSIDIAMAPSEAESRPLWAARRGISPALKARWPHKVSEDICVPRGRLVAMLEAIDDLSARFGIDMAAYGHAGDGNLHVNFLFDQPVQGERAARLEEAIAELFRRTISLRGTLSGEHGIGEAKRRFMPLEHSEASLEWQRRIKATFDPRGLLNPGKLLPGPARGPRPG